MSCCGIIFGNIRKVHKFANMKGKVYKTKEEAVAAFKKSVSARRDWEEAIRKSASREELEMKGLKTVGVHEY